MASAYFQIPVHPDLGRIFAFVTRDVSNSSMPVFESVHYPTTVHQGSLLWFRIGRIGRACASFVIWMIAGHCVVKDLSSASLGSDSLVVQGSGDRCQLGEVRPPAVHLCPVSVDADKHVSREGFPVASLSGSLSGSGDFFLLLPSPPASMWQQLLGHMASLEHFLPRGHLCMCPLQWRLKDHWSPMVDDPAVQIPLLQECIEAVCWWLQEDRWAFVSLSRFFLHPCCCIPTRLCRVGEPTLLDLTASRVWSQEESSLHINGLES